MNLADLPWLEASIAVMLAGALCVSQVRHPVRAYRWGRAFTGAACACAVVACLNYYLNDYLGGPPGGAAGGPQELLFGRQVFALDALNAPLVPAVALLHFLTALATARTKMRRFSFSWSLAAGAIRLATFSCTDTGILVSLLVAGTIPPYVELLNRRSPTRVYVLHMALFVGLLTGGWALLRTAGGGPATAGAGALLLAAVLVRCGTVPAHCWVTDWFARASFGIALLALAPLAGVYACVRLVLPVAPDWVLRGAAVASLVTAVYAAAMATVQREVRYFFAYLFLSHAALVLVGLELQSGLALTGALCLWFSVMIALGGFGLTLRALESRFGWLSLARYHGLYEHTPALAVCFLLTGLASVGFPGTLGFISTELLVDGAVSVNLYAGLAVIAAAALNGIAVVRAYFLLFTGARHVSTVSLGIGPRERAAVLTLAAVVLGGGLLPQPGVSTRQRAAEEILEGRRKRFPPPAEPRPPADEPPAGNYNKAAL
jgi:NADH-quinone oxidoreductase subunit M